MPANKRTLFPLFSETDREKASAVLAELRKLGFPASEKAPKKSGVLLLFLSESFSEDEALQERFLSAYGKKVPVVPVSLDGSAPPKLISDALYAYNTIYAERYTNGELASRIASAEPLQKKDSPLPVLLAVSAGILLLIAGGIIVWRLWPKTPGETAAETSGTEEIPDVPIPKEAGIKPEDLARVYELLIVGDQFFYTTGDEGWVAEKGWARVGEDYLANRNPEEDDGYHWYSTEDGHEIEMTKWTDLDFLKYMKNMKFLTMVRVDGKIPDLSGLVNLENVEIHDCSIPDVSGAAAPNLQYFSFYGDYVPDLSVLNRCEKIREVYFHFYHMDVVDLSQFGPASLQTFRINGNYTNTEVRLDGLKNCPKLSRAILIRLPCEDLSFLSESSELDEVGLWELWNLTNLRGLEHKTKLRDFWTLSCFELSDLSALSDASGLWKVEAENIRPQDLSWLSGAESLERLELRYCETIRSFRGLENHEKLKEIHCSNVENLRDISALGSCPKLEMLNLYDVFELEDISPVVSLPNLRDLQLYGVQLENVDFLYDIRNKDGFSFGISTVSDWSGLQAIKNYGSLNITDKNGTAFGYIRDASVRRFEFYNRSSIDDWGTEALNLSNLPNVTEELCLRGIPSLEGLPDLPLNYLEIMDSPYLTSLEGLQKLGAFRDYSARLTIENCPRLADWSALNGLSLSEFRLINSFSLPEFSKFFASRIYLENPVDLHDLHCFDNMQPEKSCSIELVGLEEVTDLSPLYTMTKGFTLQVPAHLQEQAQALVESGIFKEYGVTYPLDAWKLAELHVRLISLDELQTLPDAMLRYVDRFAMAGDILFDPDNYWVEEDWSTNPATLYLRENDSEERTLIEDGTRLTDLSVLSKLTGLWSLQLYRQPLSDLSGIQALTGLEDLQVIQTPDLRDASAAFTLQSLRRLDIRDTSVESIEGIQNLYDLEDVNICGTPVADLSSLDKCSDELRVRLNLPLMPYEEFCSLPSGVLRHLDRIMIAGEYAADPWSDWDFEEDWSNDEPTLYLHVNSTDERILLGRGVLTDLGDLPDMPLLDTLLLDAQPIQTLSGIENLPSLRKLELRQCPELTDISPLFDMPDLHEISLDYSGVRSIDGIEDLPELTLLQIGGSEVTDLSVLERIDYSYAEQEDEGGYTPHFGLGVDNLQENLPDDGYRFLSSVPYYDFLNIYNTDCRLWIDAVRNTPIRQISAGNCRFNNELLRDFAEAHPELEEIDLCWNDPRELTDLTPLLSLPDLRRLSVSENMEAAIRSLGEDYGFFLDLR